VRKKYGVIIGALLSFIFISNYAESTSTLLITEVYYDTVGTDSAEEFIEIYNPNSFPVNISDYKIGDDEEKGTGTNEGMYEFPTGTVIASYATITIALKSTGFKALFGKPPDFETTINTDSDVPDMIKYTSWSTKSIELSNTGDEFLLLNELDYPLDIVVYENGSYTGVTPHSGVSTGKSIQRDPPNQDTDNCSADFQEGTPTPTTLRNIVISPISVPVGNFVTISGQGFFATEGIVINFGTTSTIATTTTDSCGSFSTTFLAALQSNYGTVTVSAKGLTSNAKVTTEFSLLELPPLLKFEKEVISSGSATPGVTLTYILRYENVGSGTATNVVLTDAIPAGTIYIIGSTGTNTGISYSHDGGINYDEDQNAPVTHIRWELITPLAPKGSGNVRFKVRIE